jgi:putative flippase GtrA
MNLHIQFGKYLLVGTLNSAIGLLIIYVCMAAGLSDIKSNALGYLIGFFVSFTLNSRWTFSQRRSTAALIKFLLVTVVAYAANLCAMMLARDTLAVDHRLAQLVGVAAYTGVGFIGSKIYAFKSKQSSLEHPTA